MKKKVLILVCLVLFVSLTISVDAALKDSLGNIFDSISSWFQNGGWQNHTKVIDFFIWFIIFLSASMMSFTKLAGDSSNRNVYVGLSIGVALALSFALITQDKFSLAKFLFPFAKYFLVFLAVIAFFFIWKSIMPTHPVWAFILALITAFILFGAINSYVNEDGFLGWVGDSSGSSSSGEISGEISGSGEPIDTSGLNCEQYDSRINSFIENIDNYDAEQISGLSKSNEETLVNIIFTYSKGYEVDSEEYQKCIKQKLSDIRILIAERKRTVGEPSEPETPVQETEESSYTWLWITLGIVAVLAIIAGKKIKNRGKSQSNGLTSSTSQVEDDLIKITKLLDDKFKLMKNLKKIFDNFYSRTNIKGEEDLPIMFSDEYRKRYAKPIAKNLNAVMKINSNIRQSEILIFSELHKIIAEKNIDEETVKRNIVPMSKLMSDLVVLIDEEAVYTDPLYDLMDNLVHNPKKVTNNKLKLLDKHSLVEFFKIYYEKELPLLREIHESEDVYKKILKEAIERGTTVESAKATK